MAAVQLSIDGPLLSSLFYDNACCGSDQEGFLFGYTKHQIEDTVNDAQINNRTEKVIMVIQNFCTMEKPYSFYTNSGVVLEENLQKLLGEKCKNAIGWFRARKNTSLEPSFLEKIIHHNLRAMTDDEDTFLFIIFTTQNTKFVSTHTFDHVCLRSKDGTSFDAMQLHVTNLGNSAQGDYKRNVINLAPNKILENTVKPKTEPLIQSIRSSIENGLKSLCIQVSESESSCSQLEKEVERLREELRNRRGSADSSDSLSLISTNSNKRNSRLEFSLVKESSSANSNSSLNVFANPFTSKGSNDSKGSPTY